MFSFAKLKKNSECFFYLVIVFEYLSDGKLSYFLLRLERNSRCGRDERRPQIPSLAFWPVQSARESFFKEGHEHAYK